jgi:hypothetical protein
LFAISTAVTAWGVSVFVRETGDDWLSRIGHGIMVFILVASYALAWIAVFVFHAR